MAKFIIDSDGMYLGKQPDDYELQSGEGEANSPPFTREKAMQWFQGGWRFMIGVDNNGHSLGFVSHPSEVNEIVDSEPYDNEIVEWDSGTKRWKRKAALIVQDAIDKRTQDYLDHKASQNARVTPVGTGYFEGSHRWDFYSIYSRTPEVVIAFANIRSTFPGFVASDPIHKFSYIGINPTDPNDILITSLQRSITGFPRASKGVTYFLNLTEGKGHSFVRRGKLNADAVSVKLNGQIDQEVVAEVGVVPSVPPTSPAQQYIDMVLVVRPADITERELFESWCINENIAYVPVDVEEFESTYAVAMIAIHKDSTEKPSLIQMNMDASFVTTDPMFMGEARRIDSIIGNLADEDNARWQG